jgi:hypothetical protein
MATNQINLHLSETGWLATYSGPHAQRIIDLFDSATIPTAFTAQAPLAMVIGEIQSRNPKAIVKHWNS